MGIAGLVFAVFTVGYILGVWTSCFLLRQSQREYEEGVAVTVSSSPVIVLRRGSTAVAQRR